MQTRAVGQGATRTPSERARRGTVLIVVMGVLSLLAVLVLTFVSFSRTGFRASQARTHSVRMDLLAEATLNQVRGLMARDLGRSAAPFDHPRFDYWLASVWPQNVIRLDRSSNAASTWRYITRLDLAATDPDGGWAGGTGAGTGGRPPENAAINLALTANASTAVFETNMVGGRPVPTGRYEPSAAADPATGQSLGFIPIYADADGDGKADSMLLPIGGGATFGDGVIAMAAVRIVDNAHLNSRQHSRWAPYHSNSVVGGGGRVFNYQIEVDDVTDGRVDWGYVPATEPGRPHTPRPRLPHVHFQNLRNWGMVLFGGTAGYGDNPDAGEVNFNQGNGWTWDEGVDRHSSTSQVYYLYRPGANLQGGSWPLSTPAQVTPVSAAAAPGLPPSGRNSGNTSDTLDAFPLRFGIEDDLALRTWSTDRARSKYAAMWPGVFGTPGLGNAPGQNIDFERYFMRVVSSVTRERTQKWFPADDAGYHVGAGVNSVNASPVDLRKLLTADATLSFSTYSYIDPSGATRNFPGIGAPTALTTAKVNALMALFERYGILSRPAQGTWGPAGAIGVASPMSVGGVSTPNVTFPQNGGTPVFAVQPNHRRAQYLANLVEYIKGNDGPVYVPAHYDVATSTGTVRVYGNCRQPYFSEMMRWSGDPQTIANGASRQWTGANAPRVGFELYNPYDRPLSLAGYYLEVQSVPFGGVTAAGPNIAQIRLDAYGVIPPFGFVWVASDEAPPAGMPAADAAALRDTLPRCGPQTVVNLRRPATDGTPLLMDTIDTRPDSNGRPFSAGTVVNDNIAGIYGILFDDWYGSAATVAMANAGWVNSSGATVNLPGLLSGIYRPQGVNVQPASSGPMLSVYPTTCTGLWMGLGTTAPVGSVSSLTAAAGNLVGVSFTVNGFGSPTRGTPGARNPAQPPEGAGYATSFMYTRTIIGSQVLIPNRGADPLFGARFVNLGELGMVMTVGNGPSGCLSQAQAAASEYVRRMDRSAESPFALPYHREPRPSEVAGGTIGFPSLYYAVGGKNWGQTMFEREIRFDVYERARINPDTGMPVCENARILDIVSLYMGNGTDGASVADFDRHSGATAETSEDFDRNGARVRPGFREGKINVNTSPFFVISSVPCSRGFRDDMDGVNQFYSGLYDQDGCTKGQVVDLGYCMAGTDLGVPGFPSQGRGYLSQTFAETFGSDGNYPAAAFKTLQRDPYFANISDVVMFSHAANPFLAGKFHNNSGVGWDASRYCDYGYFAYTTLGGIKMYDRTNPYMNGYTYVDNCGLPWSSWTIHETQERNGDNGFSHRDPIWATASNVLSTRSDVFTAHVLIKLIRPTPGVRQFANGGLEWEDLGELRTVAVVDRTNCRIRADGTVDPAILPRILGRAVIERQ